MLIGNIAFRECMCVCVCVCDLGGGGGGGSSCYSCNPFIILHLIDIRLKLRDVLMHVHKLIIN